MKGKRIKFISVLSVFLTLGLVLPMSSAIKNNISAASGISSLWIEASSIQAASYEDGRKETDMVKWWNAEGSHYYISVPKSADLSNLKLYFEASDTVKVNGNVIASGETISIDEGTGYLTFTCASNTYYLNILLSSDIPSMFISTETGSLNKIHANKENKEAGKILVVEADGQTVSYNGDLEQIKGRGNATWEYPKKPYNIKLGSKAGLLGMGVSKKWSLLANWIDPSHMNNKVVYDLAREVGIDYTSDSKHVDLYINNEYQGLYLLTEKIEIGDPLVDIVDLDEATSEVNDEDLDSYPRGGENNFVKNTMKYSNIPNNPEDITGGYLLEMELHSRYAAEASGFVTSRGQAVVIKYPEFASKEQVEYIRGYYQDMEDAVYSTTGYNSKGKHYTDYIDEESFVKAYVLNEFSLNLDVAISSFYMYKDSDTEGDGKIHASTAWDFDNAFGVPGERDGFNLNDPKTWYASQGRIYENPDWTKHLIAALCRHSGFVEKSEFEWRTNFAPAVWGLFGWLDYDTDYEPQYIESINDYYFHMASSCYADSMRWIGYHGWSDISEYQFYNRLNFMRERFDFLNEAWQIDINELDISPVEPHEYTGSEITPSIVIKENGVELKKGASYFVNYYNNLKPGTATIDIWGYSPYRGHITFDFEIVPAERTELSDLIADANGMNKLDYSVESWNKLLENLIPAVSLSHHDTATQEEIELAFENLKEAIDALTVDKSELLSLIEEAAGLNEADYSTTKWNYLQTALNNAIDVRDNMSSTQSQINAAIIELKGAFSESDISKAVLVELIMSAESEIETDYSAESWIDFSEKLAAAVLVNNNLSAGQVQIDTAAIELNEAMRSLDVDRSALFESIAEANKKEEFDYSSESWSNFRLKFNSAIEINNSITSKQSEITTAAIELNAALNALTADKSFLRELLDIVEAMNQSDYNEDYWEYLQYYYNIALDAYNNEFSKQIDIDIAAEDLKWIVEYRYVETWYLNETIELAESKRQIDYSTESWDNMQAALAEARQILNSDDAKQSEINAASSKLSTAIDALTTDKALLSALIESVNGFNKENYTESSWNNFQLKLGNAINVNNNVSAKQFEINAAKNALTAAIDELIIANYPDPPIPGGNDKIVTLKSDENVSVAGITEEFANEHVLITEMITDKADVEKAKSSVSELNDDLYDYSYLGLMDISFKDLQNEIAEIKSGSYSVTVPFEFFGGGKDRIYAIFHIDGTGNLIPLETETDNKDELIVFKTPHFSRFVVTEITEKNSSVSSTDSSSSPQQASNPETGESSGIIMAILIFAVAGTLFVVCKKRNI